MRRQLGMGWFVLYVLALVAACSIDDFVEYGGVIGVDDGASEGVFKTQQVDGSRDVRLELKTRGAVSLPKGALTDTVEIGIERPADQDAIKLVKPLKDYLAIASAPYVLTPHGTKFKAPVTIEIPVTKQTDKKLLVGWLEDENDKTWKKLGVPTIKDGVAKIDVDHFSVLILLEEERANLAGDDAPEAAPAPDAGSRSGTTTGPMSGGGDVLIPVGSYDAGRPIAALDAGTSSGSHGGSDAGYGSVEKDAAPYPYPFPLPPSDADVYVPPPVHDGGVTTAPDAGATYDAGKSF